MAVALRHAVRTCPVATSAPGRLVGCLPVLFPHAGDLCLFAVGALNLLAPVLYPSVPVQPSLPSVEVLNPLAIMSAPHAGAAMRTTARMSLCAASSPAPRCTRAACIRKWPCGLCMILDADGGATVLVFLLLIDSACHATCWFCASSTPHRCKKLCYQECGECQELIKGVQLPCGHTADLACYK